MTHDELTKLIRTGNEFVGIKYAPDSHTFALRAVVELHTPSPIPDWVPTKEELMCWCAHVYPCPTVRAIEKELG
jgi:hypothetical protein